MRRSVIRRYVMRRSVIRRAVMRRSVIRSPVIRRSVIGGQLYLSRSNFPRPGVVHTVESARMSIAS